MVFILLVSLIIPLCLLFNITLSNTFDTNKYFFITFILLEVLLLLVFSVLDLLAFYIIFEFILIPFYIIIVLNKTNTYTDYIINDKITDRKMNAFYMLLFYTIFGSLLMLFSILLIYVNTGTTMIPLLWYFNFSKYTEYLL